MNWAKIKLENHSVDASPQSLVNRPLTFSDSFLIRSPYCCKQLLVLSILSDSGSKVSNQSELSNLISPSWLTGQHPISGIVFFVSLLSCLWLCFVWLGIRPIRRCSRYDCDVSLPRYVLQPYGLPSWETPQLIACLCTLLNVCHIILHLNVDTSALELLTKLSPRLQTQHFLKRWEMFTT